MAEDALTGLGVPTGLVRRTAHEYVSDTLRQAILGGTLAAGTRLVQASLAEELGVSTTPVREALRDLATEGLVQVDPHRGAVVRALDDAEIAEIQELSRMLEPEAARKAARVITDETLDLLAVLIHEMESESDIGRWADLNRRFHATVVQDLAGTRLVRIVRTLQDNAAPYVGLSLQSPDNQFDDANRDHRQLLEALREHDGERAAQITSRHIGLTIDVLRRARGVPTEATT